MPSLDPSLSLPSARRYRWVRAWLVIGCVNALLLLANAVRDFTVVRRWLAIQQTRHGMTATVAEVEQHLRRSNFSATATASAEARTGAGATPTARLLPPALTRSLRPGESITLRQADGLLLEHVGATLPGPVFTPEQERTAFQDREPLFRTDSTPAGLVVVEVFALHLPPTSQPSPAPADVAVPPSPRLLTLEIGLPLRQPDRSVLAPIRRNLAINLTGALSLLATVVLAGIGLRSYVKGERLEEQIGIAREVQARLLPDPAAQPPNLQLVTVYRPSEQVGGDFYDVFADPHLGFAVVIGDVSGKGLPAALLMGVIHGAVRTAPWQLSEANHEAESIRLNRLLCERASSNRFASLFWCVYGRERQRLRYVNAGHPAPFLLRRAAGAITATRLDQGGAVMGLLPDATYRAATISITPGDLLVLFSDGLVEASNAASEEFGDARLEDLLRAHFDDPLPALRDALLHAWESFSPAGAVQDDLTIAILRF